MLGRIINVCRNAKKLDRSKILEQIFRDKGLQMDMIDLNKDQMYEEGVDSQGKPLGEYAQVTVTFWKPLAAKEGRDGRTDHITLKDTGSFYDSIAIKNQREEIRFTGDMDKPDVDLSTIYPYALGLTEKNIRKVTGWILPDFRDRTLSQILK